MSKVCPVCERVYDDEHIFCAADGSPLQGSGATNELTGSVVDGRYVITSLLGEGGMGRVYLGHHVHLPRQIALKVLHARLVNDPSAMARFSGEATSAARIEHDNVARVFDFGRLPDGGAFIAMEYVAGRTLTTLIEREGPVEPSRAARIVSDIANGLQAAHRLHIVHRDLKPDNVMLATDAEGAECVKIVDFGIAKTVGPLDRGTLTAPGYVTGTPEYMSPEQLLGQEIDQRSDVFALGLVAFRALTGALPFESPTPERGFASVLRDTPKRLDAVAPGTKWPEGLQKVFDRVLARDPEARYPTALAFAGAFRDEINRWTGAKRGKAPPRQLTPHSAAPWEADTATLTVESPRNRRVLLGAIAVGSVAALGLVAMLLTRDRTDGSARDTAAVASDTTRDTARDTASDTARGTTNVGDASRAPIGATDTAPAGTNTGNATSGASTVDATPARPDRTPNGPPNRTPDRTPDRTPQGNPPGGAPVAPVGGTERPPARPTAPIGAQLDDVREGLDALLLADPGESATSRARALLGRVDAILGTTTERADSARATLLRANLLKIAGDRGRACLALEQARLLAVSNADLNAVRRYASNWGC